LNTRAVGGQDRVESELREVATRPISLAASTAAGRRDSVRNYEDVIRQQSGIDQIKVRIDRRLQIVGGGITRRGQRGYATSMVLLRPAASYASRETSRLLGAEVGHQGYCPPGSCGQLSPVLPLRAVPVSNLLIQMAMN